MILEPSANTPVLNLHRKKNRDSIGKLVESLSVIEAEVANENDSVGDLAPFEYDFSETTDEGSLNSLRGRSATSGSMLPIYRLDHGGVFLPQKYGANDSFGAFLGAVFGSDVIVEVPSSEAGPYWVISLISYYIYVHICSSSIHCSLLMEHVADFTSQAQKKVGRKLERGMDVLEVGRTMQSGAPLRSPNRRKSGGDVANAMEKQMQELTLAVCQYAHKTNQMLAEIQKSVAKNE